MKRYFKTLWQVITNDSTFDRMQLINDTHRCFIIAVDLAKEIASGELGRDADVDGMMRACRNLERQLYNKYKCLTTRDMSDLIMIVLSIGGGMIAVMDDRELEILERMNLGWVREVMECMVPKDNGGNGDK